MVVENRRVLALMPHPDDMEILCAGTLLRLRALGFEIYVATMTPGDKGSATLSREEIAAIRRGEAQRGAEAVGAVRYACLEEPDVEIAFDIPTRRKVIEMLRQVDPFLVFTTPPADYMLDHEITSMLVRNACFNAPMRNYDTGGTAPPSSRIPYLYYTDPVEGMDLFGNRAPVSCIVDISAVMDQKVVALACHESQRAWLRQQHGMDDYLDSMKRWCARRGAEIGVAYAEGFCQHRGHPHPTDDVLVQLLNAVPFGAPTEH